MIFYETLGQGRPVILTHGLGVTSETFDRLVHELVRDHEVTVWDLPGHGKSAGPPERSDFSRDAVLDDLDKIVDMQSETPILLGHSLGGYLSLAWAATRNVELPGLCILSTGPGFRNPEKREAWNAMSRRNEHRFNVPAEVTAMNLQHDSVVVDNLTELNVRTELIVGGEDNPQLIGGMEYLAAKLPDASLTQFADAGHNVHVGAGAAVVAAAVRRL